MRCDAASRIQHTDECYCQNQFRPILRPNQYQDQTKTKADKSSVRPQEMAQLCKNYVVNKSVLEVWEVLHVEQWEQEEEKFAITSPRHSGAYMLLHKTDFDPFHRTSFRYLIDFVFVPEELRHTGIAYNMLTSPLAYRLDLCAVTSNEESDALFKKACFETITGISLRDKRKME